MPLADTEANKWGAPGRIRTCDARLRSPALYPLSYEGGDLSRYLSRIRRSTRPCLGMRLLILESPGVHGARRPTSGYLARATGSDRPGEHCSAGAVGGDRADDCAAIQQVEDHVERLAGFAAVAASAWGGADIEDDAVFLAGVRRASRYVGVRAPEHRCQVAVCGHRGRSREVTAS
jgi:hypothetical protein